MRSPRESAAQVFPAGHDAPLLCKHRAQLDGHHVLVGFWYPLQLVPSKIEWALLPAAGLELPSDRLGQAHMGVTDRQLDVSEAALNFSADDYGVERGDECALEALALTHFQAEQLAADIGVDCHGHDCGSGAYLQPPPSRSWR